MFGDGGAAVEVPPELLDWLRSAGVILDGVFVGDQQHPIAFAAVKPVAAGGNALSRSGSHWEGETFTDLPWVIVEWQWERLTGGRWTTRALTNVVPGPGPDFFQREHPTADAAVADVLAYFFGDHEAIRASREYRRQRWGEAQDAEPHAAADRGLLSAL